MEQQTFSYDKAMQDLEKIVERIESGDCKIDELTAEVKKAAELITLCKKKLQDVNVDINKAFSDFSE